MRLPEQFRASTYLYMYLLVYLCRHNRDCSEVNVSVLQFQMAIHIVEVAKFVHRLETYPLIVPLARATQLFCQPLERDDDETCGN